MHNSELHQHYIDSIVSEIRPEEDLNLKRTVFRMAMARPDEDKVTLICRTDRLTRLENAHIDAGETIDISIVPSEKLILREHDIVPIALLGLAASDERKRLMARHPVIRESLNNNVTPARLDTLLYRINYNEPEKFEALLREVFTKELAHIAEKIEDRRLGKLTFGIEVEVIGAAKVKQVKEIDALQDLGFPISYDGVREIPIPKSNTTHEQLRTLYYLIKAGYIKPEQRIGIHFNVGGIPRLDENMFLLDQLINGANVFQETIVPSNAIHVDSHAAKPLYEDHDPYFSENSGILAGMPFRVRSSGVIEFRWFPVIADPKLKHPEKTFSRVPFRSTVKGVESIELLLEAVRSFQLVETGRGNKTDKKLAQVWGDVVENTLENFAAMGLDRNTCYSIPETQKEYIEHIAMLRMNVANISFFDSPRANAIAQRNAERQRQLYNKVILARRDIRTTLKEDKELQEYKRQDFEEWRRGRLGNI